MGRFLFRFKQFGGLRLFRAYCKNGLASSAVIQTAKVLLHKQTPVEASRVLSYKITPKLTTEFSEYYKSQQIEKGSIVDSPRRVWTCWLQGLEDAPTLVKACINSQKRNIKDREHVVITDSNVFEYIELPEFIVAKYRDGIVPPALFTDLIRLELLIRYGGTWMDSTVMVNEDADMRELLDADFFMFQSLRDGQADGKYHGISNWYITAKAGHPWLIAVRDLLFEYWRRYDCVLEYFIFHIMFGIVIKDHQDEWVNVPVRWNAVPLKLSRHMFDEYNEQKLMNLNSKTPVHKLSYRIRTDNVAGTYYEMLTAYVK